MTFDLAPGHRRYVQNPDGSNTWTTDAAIDLGVGETATITGTESIRNVNPGENIETLSASWPVLSLKPGTHSAFEITTAGVEVRWQTGATVPGGAWIAANNVTFLNPKVADANRGIRIANSGAYIQNPDISTVGNGIYFDGANAKGTVQGGKVYNCTRMIRNDTNSNNDFGAIAFAFDDTVGPVTIRGVNIYGNRVQGPSYSGSGWNYANSDVGQRAGPAMLSRDYTTNEGTAFEFWQSRGVTIEDCWGNDNQVVVETGKGDAGQDCQITMRRSRWWSGASSTRVAKGLLLRSATNSVIEHNVLDGMGDWGILLSNSGGFAGALTSLVIRDNIAITPSAFIRRDGSPSGYSQSYNLVGGSGVWGDVSPGTGGKTGNPMFVDAPFHDYRLKSGSPALSAAHDGSNIGAY